MHSSKLANLKFTDVVNILHCTVNIVLTKKKRLRYLT